MYTINVNDYSLQESYKFIKDIVDHECSADVTFVKNNGVTLLEHRFTRFDDVYEFVNTLYSSLSKKQEERYKHGNIECIVALRSCLSEEEFRGFCKGNVIKYLWRSEYKGGKEDLEKARDYLDYLLEEEIIK